MNTSLSLPFEKPAVRFAPLAAVLALALVLAGCDSSTAPGPDGSSTPEAQAAPQSTPGAPEAKAEKNLVAPASDGPDLIEGQYIVVYKDGAVRQLAQTSGLASTQAATQALTNTLAQQTGAVPQRHFSAALQGFSGELSKAAAATLADDPRVEFVEQDQRMHIVASQPNATWGLDRVDARSGLDSEYTYDATGAGVTAYIVDTGINTSHNDFGGRATAGFTAFNDDGQDGNGHGTHVAGTVGGSTYGVAKGVSLVGVKVLDDNGSGTTSGVIDGVDYVAQNASGAAVANMSLGGGASTALDNAVQNAVNQGVTFVVAAGNSNANACNSSPARVNDALTTGATTSSDRRASYSNYGSCVDLFAPGSNITSAWYTSDTATNTISGTSMASPHVAGAAALYLEDNGSASPATVFDAVTSSATSGAVSNVNGSPNLLLYSLFDGSSSTPPGNGGGGDDGSGDGAPCSSCAAYGGSLSSGGYEYQPDGNYYQSPSGTQRGYLRGPSSADFDLKLWKYGMFGWNTVASSTSASSSEDISYSGSSGYYVWRIESYSGSGSYDFYLNRP